MQLTQQLTKSHMNNKQNNNNEQQSKVIIAKVR